MEVRDVFALALKRKWVVIMVTLLTAGLGAAFAFSQPKKYEAVATVALTPDTNKDTGFVPSDTLSALVQTYAQTARSHVNIQRAERLNGGPPPGPGDREPRGGAGTRRTVGKAPPPRGPPPPARVPAQAFLDSTQDTGLPTASRVAPGGPPPAPAQPRPPLIVAVSAL